MFADFWHFVRSQKIVIDSLWKIMDSILGRVFETFAISNRPKQKQVNVCFSEDEQTVFKIEKDINSLVH